jgi:alpha-L-fucosidase
LADPDLERLKELGAALKAIYTQDVAHEVLHSRLPWAPNTEEAELTVDFPEPVSFDLLMLQEDLNFGQRVEGFVLEAWSGDGWIQVTSGTTIGHKRLLLFPAMSTSRIRLRITESRLPPNILTISLFDTFGKVKGVN